MPARKLPTAGTKFNSWTFSGVFSGRLWLCFCSCGRQAWVHACHVRSGASKSCHGKSQASHGATGSKAYRAWTTIKQRCLNKKHASYGSYGARGVNLHPDWVKDFPAFAAHLGAPPSETHTVERLDNSKGYEPGNVVWATPKEQARNRKSNRWLTIDGVEACIVDWCAFTGINPSTAHNRMRLYGCTPEQAVGLAPPPWAVQN